MDRLGLVGNKQKEVVWQKNMMRLQVEKRSRPQYETNSVI